MPIGRRDLRMVRGTNRTYRVTVFDADADGDPPIDISGATIVFTLNDALGDGTPVFTKSSAVGPTEVTILPQVGDTLGQADIFLVPADTAALFGLHYYDVVATLADGTVHSVIEPAEFFIEKSPSV